MKSVSLIQRNEHPQMALVGTLQVIWFASLNANKLELTPLMLTLEENDIESLVKSFRH